MVQFLVLSNVYLSTASAADNAIIVICYVGVNLRNTLVCVAGIMIIVTF